MAPSTTGPARRGSGRPSPPLQPGAGSGRGRGRLWGTSNVSSPCMHAAASWGGEAGREEGVLDAFFPLFLIRADNPQVIL